MRFSQLSTLAALPVLALAGQEAQAQAAQITPAPEVAVVAPVPEQTQVLTAPAPGEAWNQEVQSVELELRQATEQNLAATQAETQQGTVTSYWIASYWDKTQSSEIWVDVAYTQTFASHPGLLTTAGAGSIGLGTHTGVVGVVKDTKSSSAASVMAQGTLLTAAIAVAGVAAGMAAVLL